MFAESGQRDQDYNNDLKDGPNDSNLVSNQKNSAGTAAGTSAAESCDSLHISTLCCVGQ